MKSKHFLPLLCALLAGPWTAAAQTATATGERPVTFVNSVGDVLQQQSPITGKIHLQGNAGITTGDYLRGAFDGVPEDGDWGFLADMAMIVELADLATFGADTNLTLGIANGLSDDDPFNDVGHPSLWYQADPYAGLTFRLGNNAMAGLTYTAYSSPNDIAGTRQELALTASYAGADFVGALGPAFKVAVPVHGGSGMYLEAAVKPDIEQLIGVRMPVRTFVPTAVGIGLNEYYGDDLDVYVSTGLAASVPLNLPAGYGNWSLDGSLNLIFRGDDLEAVGEPYDNGGNTVVYAALGVKFIY